MSRIGNDSRRRTAKERKKKIEEEGRVAWTEQTESDTAFSLVQFGYRRFTTVVVVAAAAAAPTLARYIISSCSSLTVDFGVWVTKASVVACSTI
jgi:hypothetical protein